MSGDRIEMEFMRIAERAGPVRTALTDIEVGIAVMDAAGQAMAILSINPRAYSPTEPPARYRWPGSDSLAHLAGIPRSDMRAPQALEAAAAEVERIMGPRGLHVVMIDSHTPATTPTNRGSPRCPAASTTPSSSASSSPPSVMTTT